MSALTQASPAILHQLLTTLSPEQLAALGLRRPATDAEVSAYEQAHQTPGAPADFGGMVLPNPNGIQVSDDTDSGIPVTRLPNGVSFDRSNFHGAMPGDVSNPPRAEILAPTMQTVAAQSSPEPQKTDTVPVFSPDGTLGDIPSDRLPHALQAGAKPGVNIIAPDGSKGIVPADRYVDAVKAGAKVAPFEEQEVKHPGFWSTLGEDLRNMIPRNVNTNANDATWQAGRVAAAEHQRVQDQANQAAADAWRKQHGYSGVYRATAPLAEGIGVNVPGMEQAAEEGNVAGVAGHAAAVPAVMAATEGLVRGTPVVASAVKASAKAARPAIGATLRAASDIVDPEVTGIISPRLAHAQKVAGRLGKALETREAPPAVTPSAAEDFEGVTSPQTEHAANSEPEAAPAETPESLKETSASVKETPAEILNKKASPADLERTLNEALGGKPLARNAPIAKRPGVTAVDTSKPEALPEGYTPTQSSVLKGYKYDSANETLHAITNSGQHYAHGGITPEQFDAFEAAPSKGAEWNNLRKAPGVVQVEKNFQPSKPGTITTETGEVIPKSKAGMTTETTEIPPELAAKVQNLSDFIKQTPKKAMATPAAKAAAIPAAGGDLTSLLQQSVEQATGKGGVFTSAEPKALLDRWGVDPESFAAGREQTRGLKPEESAAGIKKLTAAYKRGEAIEPVVEMRDAQNNIIEVDGRGRALAAHKAGIDRIPIIVRRIGASE